MAVECSVAPLVPCVGGMGVVRLGTGVNKVNGVRKTGTNILRAILLLI